MLFPIKAFGIINFLEKTMPRSDGIRYKKLVDINGPNGCWNWLGSINKRTGYGKKQWFRETWLAHRWVWTMLFGNIREGMTIDHLCSNRRCVNPAHLEVVSQIENQRRGKGTTLTEEDVRDIRSLPKKWGDRIKLAEQYGVSPMTISDIRSGRSWKDI